VETIMPYSVDWEPQGAIIRLQGTVKIADYLELVEEHRAHHYDEPCYHIYDYSALRAFEISSDELVRLREAVKTIRQGAAPLFVATIDTSKIARRFVGRLLAHRVSPCPIESFLTEQSARRWVERRIDLACAMRGHASPAQFGAAERL
jgi:hypothetical protein